MTHGSDNFDTGAGAGSGGTGGSGSDDSKFFILLNRIRSLENAIPDWVWKLSTERDLTTFIIASVATWIVASILGLWAAVLGTIEYLFLSLVGVVWALGNTVAAALSPFWQALEGINWAAAQIEGMISQVGLLAPVATTASWLLVVMLIAVVINVIIGILSTYLPVRAIPFIGGRLS